jgi:hypothetical protein
MAVRACRGAVPAVVVLSVAVYLGLIYLMVCEFVKAVE